jgi:GH24 family phage-related lysozyme (muramidase)
VAIFHSKSLYHAEKAHSHDHSRLSGDLSAEGNQSAWPPAFSVSASAADPNLGPVAQRKLSDDQFTGKKREISKTAIRLSNIKVPGIPQNIVNKIAESEGIRLDVYQDSLGILTVGLGHELTVSEKKLWVDGTVLTEAEVVALAKSDIGNAWAATEKQCTEIGVSDQGFQLALFEVNFQLGIYWNNQHVKTWNYMLAKEWESAAREAAKSKWNAQTPIRLANFQAALRKLNSANAQPKSEEGFDLWEKLKTNASKKVNDISDQKSQVQIPAMPEGIEGVRKVQSKLKGLGLYAGTVDGVEFRKDGKESMTTKGIKAFQKEKKLPVTGKMTNETWAALEGKGSEKSLFGKPLSELVKSSPESEANPVFFEELGKIRASIMGEKQEDWKPAGDVVADDYFVSQSPDATGSIRATLPGWSNCRQAATDIVLRYLKEENPEMQKTLGINANGDLSRGGGFLRILEEEKSQKQNTKEEANYKQDDWLLAHGQANLALGYIDEKLAQKVPVVVGVDHTFNRNLSKKKSSKSGNGYNEGTTDHYITLTGSGVDENGGKFYSYFEVGTGNKEKGTSASNRLYETGKGKFVRKGAGARGNQTYHISMVLVFKNDRQRFKNEIEENRSTVKNLNK